MRSMGALIFDMDGTLIDSMPQHAEAFAAILNRRLQISKDFSANVYLKTAGEPLDWQFKHAIELSELPVPMNLDGYLDEFWHLVTQQVAKPFSDVPHNIELLNRAGFLLFVTSGCSPEVVEAKLTTSGLRPFFKLLLGTVYGDRNLTKGEGHFRQIREYLNVSNSEFCETGAMIGDGKHDILIARQAGLFAIGRITRGNEYELLEAGADRLVFDFDELVQLFASSNSEHNSVEHFQSVNALRE